MSGRRRSDDHRRGRFTKLYYDELARETPEVWDEPDLLFTQARLQALAESVWPVVPEVPRTLKPAHIQRLADLGTIERVGSHSYRIPGYDEERRDRHEHAKHAAGGRWGDAPGNAPSNASGNARPARGREPEPEPEAEPPAKYVPEEVASPPAREGDVDLVDEALRIFGRDSFTDETLALVDARTVKR